MPQKTQQNLVRRPPVIVVMGHIDHGKSTLLDYIRKANVVAGEAGGITQHVGAYEANGLTFLDTPGHEAFGGIRKRGAAAADIAILVVSAEDGVKPQTLDAYREIKASGIPYIVAINKIDKPNADANRTRQSLGEHEIYVEGWGGDIPCVEISALTGQGVPELLDMIQLVADLADLKADPAAPATGAIIESKIDAKRGISATLLVKNGTLKVGDFVIAGRGWTPVRYIENFLGKRIDAATPSMPAVILGWNETPETGVAWQTAATKKEAEKLAGEYKPAAPKLAAPITKKSADGESVKIGILPLLVKADVIGSLEGVKYELSKIKHDKVQIKIVAEGIGDINENDVKMAVSDPNVIILGFNSVPDKKATAIIERSATPIQVKTYKIIYELAEYVRTELMSRVPKEYIEEITGRAKIAAIFSQEKDRQVVGGKVQEGLLESGSTVRIMRREAQIGTGVIRELQQQKKRVSEVREGYEFGTMIESKMEIAAGDKIEAFHMIEKK